MTGYFIRGVAFEVHRGILMPDIGLGLFRLHNYNFLYRTMDYSWTENNTLIADTGPIVITREQLQSFMRGEIPDPTIGPRNIFRPHHIAVNFGDIIRMFRLACLASPGAEHIDMYLIHFLDYMFCDEYIEPLVINYLAIAKIKDVRKLLGITNFSMYHLRKFTDVLALGIVIIREEQMEYVPHHVDCEMIAYCITSNILYHTYRFFSILLFKNNELLVDPIVKKIANRYQSSPIEVLITWALKHGIAVIPKTNKAAHMRGNIEVDFKLSTKDMKALNALAVYTKKNSWDPSDVA